VGISVSLANAIATTFQLPALKQVVYVLEREMFIVKMLDLRYFTMLCKDAEYENMDQGKSLGQLCNVQN